jgi:hypothetical protein
MTNPLNLAHGRLALTQVIRDRSYPLRHSLEPVRSYLGKSASNKKGRPDSLAQAFEQSAANMLYCHPRQNDVIWASAQRTGHNWLAMMYTIIAEAIFNDKRIGLQDMRQARPQYYRHTIIRRDLSDHITQFAYHLPVPRLMHTHSRFLGWMAARKILLQVRSPQDVIISRYFHGRVYRDLSFRSYLSTWPVEETLLFFTTWGEAIARQRLRNYHIVRYEALKRDTLATMQSVLAFFGIVADTELINYAIQETRADKVQQREQARKGIDDVRELHHVRSGDTEQAKTLVDEDREALQAVIKAGLKYDSSYRNTNGGTGQQA